MSNILTFDNSPLVQNVHIKLSEIAPNQEGQRFVMKYTDVYHTYVCPRLALLTPTTELRVIERGLCYNGFKCKTCDGINNYSRINK